MRFRPLSDDLFGRGWLTDAVHRGRAADRKAKKWMGVRGDPRVFTYNQRLCETSGVCTGVVFDEILAIR